MLTLRHLAPALILGGVFIAGCGQKADPLADAGPSDPLKPAKAPGAASSADPEPGKAVADSKPADPMHLPFAQAIGRDGEVNPPGNSDVPPTQLTTGKHTILVLDAVKASWDSIRFTTPAGKKIAYTADLQTSEGVIRMQLLPEQAPNHVRNFIALARAGYYDGLCFERLRKDVSPGGETFECVEGGCPRGSGEVGHGHINYWMKDELTPPAVMKHDEGVVGACRGEEKNTSACRFYISLTKAPWLDGGITLFGKVTTGLDVARKIFGGEVVSEDREIQGGRRPVKPVVIHKVTIHQQEN
jgi:peptidyl-prolyl cis-trans isomerase B (cyclophilin B)